MRLFRLLLVAAALAVPEQGRASPIYSVTTVPGGINALYPVGWETVQIGGFQANAGVVRLRVRDPAGQWTTQDALATGQPDDLPRGDAYRLVRLGDLVSDPVKLGQLGALLANAWPHLRDPAAAAALQIAFWEILNEPGDSGYGIASGRFQAGGVASGLDWRLVADARLDLDKVASGAWQPDPGLEVWAYEPQDGDLGQGFAFLAPRAAPAPEPIGASVLAAGLAVLAAMRWRGRRHAGFRRGAAGHLEPFRLYARPGERP